MSWFCTSVPKILIARCLVAKLRLETNKLVISGQFLLFSPCHIQKLRDTMILHQRTKNYDNNKFGCRVMALAKQAGHLGPIFAFLPPRRCLKIFFIKIKQKHLEILVLPNCAPKIMIKWRLVTELWVWQTDRLFWANFCLFTPLAG